MEAVNADALETLTGLTVARIEQVLADRGLSHTDVWKALPMSESGYWRMLRHGTMDLRRVVAIANIAKVEPERLLCGPVARALVVADPPEQYGRSVLQRLSDLEAEVRKLKERLRPQ